jgi:ABC-type glycerol-3-phosphate transport system substrate-binding protein
MPHKRILKKFGGKAMKKSNLARRVLGAMLSILMLTSLLVACDTTGNVTSTESAKAMTITLTMIKEEGMTQDGIDKVQAALNEITENRYNTHVVLQMFTAEEYAAKVIEMSGTKLEPDIVDVFRQVSRQFTILK